MRSKIIGGLLCVFILMGSFFQVPISCAENSKKPVEKLYTWDDTKWKVRRHYGLVAKNVAEAKIENVAFSESVYIRRKGERTVRELDLDTKKVTKMQNYPIHTVAKRVKEFYPMGQDMLFLDSKNQLRLIGNNFYLFAKHTSAKECKKEKKHHVNIVVEGNLNPKKCWSDSGMFAYVKRNNLYVTGIPAAPKKNDDERIDCWKYEKPRVFFQGKGNQIRQVVCGQGTGSFGFNIFVLMKDGSVWGMGNNKDKLISDSEMKDYNEFVQIISKGVKKIYAGPRNMAAIKNDNALYVWGHTMKARSSKKHKNTARPQKIATNVKEAAISGIDDTTLIFLKRNGVAYGMGLNSGYILTDKYKKD